MRDARGMNEQLVLPLILGLLVGAVAGFMVGVFAVRARAAAQLGRLGAQLDAADAALSAAQIRQSTDESRVLSVEKVVAPVTESLSILTKRIDDAERSRTSNESAIAEQLKAMAIASGQLRHQTSALTYALSRSEFRGRWGEAQLRRVVEAAGLMRGVDFVEQLTVVSEDSKLRPDMVITLSNDRKIVVDAKVALDAFLAPTVNTPEDDLAGSLTDASGRNMNRDAYIASIDLTDDQDRLKAHAAAVASHIDRLGSKDYWRQFSSTPEFVVMFLPAESLLGAALNADPALLERAFAKNVILATPSTLLALLRTVAMGWRDQAVAENAKTIHEVGRELLARLQVFSTHLSKAGGSLDSAVTAYNKAVGSLEGRVMVSARKMSELGLSSEQIAEVCMIDRTARSVNGVAALAPEQD